MTSDAVKALADKYSLRTGDKIAPPPARPRAPTAFPIDIVEPSPAPQPAEPPRTRWSTDRARMFKAWGPVALYVAGTRHPVPRGIGDNRLGWPLRIGMTSTWDDGITKNMDAQAPYHWQGVWFRVWTPSTAHYKRLAFEVVNALLPPDEEPGDGGSIEHEIRRWVRAERARHSWLDVGAEFDFPVADRKVEQALGLAPLPRTASTDAVRERKFLIVRHKFITAIRALATSRAIETWDDVGVERALDAGERQQQLKAVEGRRGR